MSLTTALGSALSGLKANQAGLDVVAGNVANASTPGYVRKSTSAVASVAGGATTGVRTTEVKREIDLQLQKQLRTETAGSAYASTRATFLDQLQSLFGTPGGEGALDALVSDLSTSIDALAASPDDPSARAGVLQQAGLLAQQLNAATEDVQALRGYAEQGLKDGVDAANEALSTIEATTRAIVQAQGRGASTADLEDQRDMAVNTLAGLMDIKVESLAGGDLRIKTQGGLTLYDNGASTLAFTGGGAPMTAGAAYAPEASRSTLGTVTLTSPSGYSSDLLANGGLRSGEMKAYAELRDETLPEAQTQLDELASQLALAFGSTATAGETIDGGVALATQGAQPGDRMTLAYASGGAQRTATIVNVTDPSRLPLSGGLIGVDFASPTAAADIEAALQAAGAAIDVAATDDGFAFTSGAAGVTVSGGSSRVTAAGLKDGTAALPLFVDGAGGDIYSESLDGGAQRAGFAGRIAVNPDLIADPSALVETTADAAAGDQTRVNFLRDALSGDRTFSGDAGLRGSSSPFTGTLSEFAQGIIATQASASASASRVADGQALVVSSLEDRFSSASGVDVDEEMTKLIQYQTAYSANARVMTTVNDMLQQLLNIL
ncbi:flagellar hook-associated protein FlgK [Methylopila jiangsuensis]|uniref:Flagellar hook-associated protein 1 n=1 Tax=Methylopila jiangsuensis TaxID=586230 RepID=A0A9W6JJ06_9HYPH|nr:flagellar hook-associated protein FlgK [Methylopila jiangsuensis]MDR6287138.1 flagellar hook-associated protein 1 FlgK [Methylopila jiangsuensis]GLK76624.1 flagellar hook-associated protein FlgK [Methylopila jiangsuensis]